MGWLAIVAVVGVVSVLVLVVALGRAAALGDNAAHRRQNVEPVRPETCPAGPRHAPVLECVAGNEFWVRCSWCELREGPYVSAEAALEVARAIVAGQGPC